jgi:hypothetical protein
MKNKINTRTMRDVSRSWIKKHKTIWKQKLYNNISDTLALTTRKKWIYASIVALFTAVSFIFVSGAWGESLGGYEIIDLYVAISEQIKDVNDILAKAFNLSTYTPFQVINAVTGTQAERATAIINAVKTAAFVVATLLLLVEFFKKTVTFEWSSKWENILLFLIKIIVIKIVIQNADVIVGYIYSGFDYINREAMGGSVDFLPYGVENGYYYTKTSHEIRSGWTWTWDLFVGNEHTYYYYISHDAIKIFYHKSTFPTSLSVELTDFPNPTTHFTFIPLVELLQLLPFFLIMWGTAVIIFVIVIGRIFELTVYTIFAPLPLATFASDTTSDVGKGFIKSYIACVLQIAVIIVMFLVYNALTSFFFGGDFPILSGKLIQFIFLISLTLGVIKSGAWAKKICGAG